MISLTIDASAHDQRLDRFLRKYCKSYPDITLKDIYHWIRKGIVKVDGRKRKENFRLQEWHTVEIHTEFNDIAHESLTTKHDKKQKMTLKQLQPMLLDERKDFVVFDKPAGIVMHPWQKHNDDLTMNDYLDIYVSASSIAVSPTFSPAFCFRLDKDTSGIVIAGLSYEAVKTLNEQIRKRTTNKEYRVLVNGHTPASLRMDQSLRKYYNKEFDRAQVKVSRDGQTALSQLTTIKHLNHPLLGHISLCSVRITTWRLHQIRAHCAHAGHSVLGDIIYGEPSVNRLMYKKLGINRQLLHCHTYSRRDTQWRKVSVTSEIGDDFRQLINAG